MASIIKRKKSYSLVYNYVDEKGETKQKWETWHTHKEAMKRKAKTQYVTNSTISQINKLLRCAFHQAVRWEMIGKNPFEHTILAKVEYKNVIYGMQTRFGLLWMNAVTGNSILQ
ncbi:MULTISPECIES: hypothetical protein [unclassified Breznakia]|uniref:hypothetical protein n=1 Tax=unclassified Breznakia TaxID=2623764 RepID=UPI0024758456|nr:MULTISPECIES: hypothetical protein [unclassified Breznakia]MDH6367339.1 hypothetical protein [Breznakia sp. PH1-1]MDH6404513.1 hypothetical protein [Breznakia sp. PF1-11]MDH6412222.1 hypothetical protein [Breznakia sp. PFB1-11]MDH6414506.1 hypothetical protein [Breznakia sp. PFB1-14]MDH6416886.1 hypothetical protein [Breznakia sp. PFB1-4]